MNGHAVSVYRLPSSTLWIADCVCGWASPAHYRTRRDASIAGVTHEHAMLGR